MLKKNHKQNDALKNELDIYINYAKTHTEEEYLNYMCGRDLIKCAHCYRETYGTPLTKEILRKYGIEI